MFDSKYYAPGSSMLLPLLLKPNSDCPLLSLETAASSPRGPGPSARKLLIATPAHSASPLPLGSLSCTPEHVSSWDFVVPDSIFKTAQVEVWVLYDFSALTTVPLAPTPRFKHWMVLER